MSNLVEKRFGAGRLAAIERAVNLTGQTALPPDNAARGIWSLPGAKDVASEVFSAGKRDHKPWGLTVYGRDFNSAFSRSITLLFC
jgi:hypothetical protein